MEKLAHNIINDNTSIINLKNSTVMYISESSLKETIRTLIKKYKFNSEKTDNLGYKPTLPNTQQARRA